MTFANPTYLYLIFLIIPLIIWYIVRLRHTQPSFKLSSTSAFKLHKGSLRTHFRHLPFALRVISIILTIIILARPQSITLHSTSHTEGIDIILAIDVSGSMLAEDFSPHRLDATKKIAAQFINDRPNDNIGLVVFAGESYTQCPLTTDHRTLLNLLDQLQYGDIQDGTAIGMGLATSINRLKESNNSRSRVVILLTDGSNNSGEIAPLSAGEIAQALGIRVYTIGVGKEGTTSLNYNGVVITINTDLDNKTLQQVAQMTGGEYFRAIDNESLANIYKQIDQMEKHRIEHTSTQKKELFIPFAIALLLSLTTEWLLRRTIFQYIP